MNILQLENKVTSPGLKLSDIWTENLQFDTGPGQFFHWSCPTVCCILQRLIIINAANKI